MQLAPRLIHLINYTDVKAVLSAKLMKMSVPGHTKLIEKGVNPLVECLNAVWQNNKL